MIPLSSPSSAHAYLQNALRALQQQQVDYAATVLTHLCCQLGSSVPDDSGWSYGVGLDPGLSRKHNEDYPFVVSRSLAQKPFGLFLVADGMGGHEDGLQAATVAVHGLVDLVFSTYDQRSLATGEDMRTLLLEGIRYANQMVYQRNQWRGAPTQAWRRARMGTTLTAALCYGSMACVANVGDSRTYLFRDHLLYQLTRDHSTVALLAEKGAITPEEVYTHPRRNEIYRCLGEKEPVEVDCFGFSLHPGDRLLLCSDGLWELVPQPAEMATVLDAPVPCSEQANRLVQLALRGGGTDNISCVVAKYELVVSPLVAADVPTLALP